MIVVTKFARLVAVLESPNRGSNNIANRLLLLRVSALLKR